MESRACYGYYGEGHGCTGEIQPVTHKSGWRFMSFYFEVKGKGFSNVEIKACDYAHAVKQLKRWAKRDGFEIVGDKKGFESQAGRTQEMGTEKGTGCDSVTKREHV